MSKNGITLAHTKVWDCESTLISGLSCVDMSSQEEASSSRLPGFSVDSSLIPTVESSEELRELGVCAFAQETFEKGFIEQVDKALAEQEAALREKRLRKDVRRILDQIR